eukprot:gnl/TRDRNA2_/TRDRNA2_171882_c0_seq1.p2 gnl/TRDRNA2_/TRDRNA2_171882_c0~~gnl/TRDRNA2_/TRDRNA2_171882_c0_seq1.p2  ORF type:complete len:174 (+),score=48.80 gnl/TRDRNA2_/TRDRNA2_171882_c0_seq1:207-728(+)
MSKDARAAVRSTPARAAPAGGSEMSRDVPAAVPSAPAKAVTAVGCEISRDVPAAVPSAPAKPAPTGGSGTSLDVSAVVPSAGVRPVPAGGSESTQDAPAAAPSASTKAAAPDMLAWLQALRLEAYHAAMLEHGFEEVEDLRFATPAELEEMFSLVGVKPGHALRFRLALRDAK